MSISGVLYKMDFSRFTLKASFGAWPSAVQNSEIIQELASAIPDL